MLKPYEAVCYELLRPAEVQHRREQAAIAYVSLGSLEWHGLQNPLGTDALKAHAICCEAARTQDFESCKLLFAGTKPPPEGSRWRPHWEVPVRK